MNDITDEQRNAVVALTDYARANSKTHMGARISTVLSLLPSDLTKADLPDQPGVYADKDGSPWHFMGGIWWFGNTDRHPKSTPEDAKHIQSFAPFTRLVPERPQITGDLLRSLYNDAPADQSAFDYMAAELTNGPHA